MSMSHSVQSLPGSPSAASASTSTSTSISSRFDVDVDHEELELEPVAAPTATPTPTPDRQTLLDGLKACLSPASYWTTLPEAYQIDKEFVLACLRRSRALPHKSDFERKFPQSLRFDRDVILAFCARPDFPELYDTRHLYPPECLISDKDVMLAYCSKIPRSLQECAEDLTDDRDVVEAAIALDGLELQYASPRLQEDEQVVRHACCSDGRALEFCPPGPLRNSLSQDRDFMLQVLRKQGGPMLKFASESLRDDRELVLVALANGMRFRFCPPIYQTDESFLLEALQHKAELYLEINRPTQSGFDLALTAVVSPTSTPAVLEKAVALVPSLQTNRQVALAIAQHGSRDYITTYFIEGNGQFRDDKEIVLAVLKKDVGYFSHVSDRLKADKDVLIASMNRTTALDVLKIVSPQLQERHPEITVHAIRVVSSSNLRYLRPYVQPDSLWRTKPVAIAWIQRGNRCMNHFTGFYDDPEFALEVAAHCCTDFHLMAADLRASLDFMQQAVDRNGCVVRFASTDLQSNCALLVRAVAQTSYALWPDSPVTPEQLEDYVDTKLNLQKLFMEEFLRGIAISNPRLPPPRRSALPLLDRGVETSEAFKRLIAEFLGVPFGTDLALLRAAQSNLRGHRPSNPPPPHPQHPVVERDIAQLHLHPADEDFFPGLAFGGANRIRRAGRPVLLWDVEPEDELDWVPRPEGEDLPQGLFEIAPGPAEAQQEPAEPVNRVAANAVVEQGIQRRAVAVLQFRRPRIQRPHLPARLQPLVRGIRGVVHLDRHALHRQAVLHDELPVENPPVPILAHHPRLVAVALDDHVNNIDDGIANEDENEAERLDDMMFPPMELQDDFFDLLGG